MEKTNDGIILRPDVVSGPPENYCSTVAVQWSGGDVQIAGVGPDPEDFGTEQFPTKDKRLDSIFQESECDLEFAAEQPRISANWGQLLKAFTQETTLHGIRYAMSTGDTRLFGRRILWSLILLGATCIFIFYTYDRVALYLSYQKTVNVEVNYVAEVEFPAVTICNQNAFKLTSATSGGWYEKVKTLATSLEEKPEPICYHGHFMCASDSQCVTSDDVCDGFADCADGSDENNCETCHQLQVEAAEEIPLLQNLMLQLLTSQKDNEVIYSSTSLNYSPIFLRQMAAPNNASWQMTDSLENGHIFASSLNIGHPPTLWNVSMEQQWHTVNIYFTCLKPVLYKPRFENLITNKTTNMTLKDMYVTGHHLKHDVIESCNWKGERCSADDFATIFTDLGLCYQFKPPTKVEKSGPGFGLGLTLNIEQYEYTKNVQSGVGVQLLLHDAEDLALMKEKSIALSPGLYSLVSIERTEVENVEPPWGNCSQKKLKYYDYYTLATCSMDCENAIVREQCGCIDIHMPDPDGYPVCTIEAYVNCARPKLEEFRRGGSCECKTPCEEKIYVPSLSFSSITINTDSLTGAEKRKLDNWKVKLSRAREIMYRIYPDKYRHTQKVFHTMLSATGTTYNTLHDVSNKMNAELADVTGILRLVNSDCISYMNRTQTLISGIRRHIRNPISEYRRFFSSSILDSIYVLRSKTRAVILKYVAKMSGNCTTTENSTVAATTTAVNAADATTYAATTATVTTEWLSNLGGNNSGIPKFVSCVLSYLDAVGCYDPTTWNVANMSFVEFWNLTDGLNLTDRILNECTQQREEKAPQMNTAKNLASELRWLYESLYSSIEYASETLHQETLGNFKFASTSDSRLYVLRREIAEPLLAYLASSCDWCLARDNDTSLVEILTSAVIDVIGRNLSRDLDEKLRRLDDNATCHLSDVLNVISEALNSQTGRTIKGHLNYMKIITNAMNSDGYLLSGGFLEDIFPQNNTNDTEVNEFAFTNSSVMRAIEALLSVAEIVANDLFPSLLRKIDLAVDLVAGFQEYVKPNCRGDLRNLQDNYEDSNTAITWVLDDVMRRLYRYEETLRVLRKQYSEAASITLEELAVRLGLPGLVYFVNTKVGLVESMLNDKILYTRRTRDHVNRLYYWFSAQATDAVMAYTNLWRRFAIVQATYPVRGGDDGFGASRPLASSYQVNTTELTDYWQYWEMNDTKDVLVQSARVLTAQAQANQVYLDDFVRGNTIENNFYRQNFLEVDMFYKELADRIVEQQKAYEYPALLSEVGGLLGLLLGASVLTLCEFLDLVVVNMIRQFTLSRARKKVRNSSPA